MSKLTTMEADHALSDLPKWTRKDEKWIERKFRFQTYLDGIQFVNQVAEEAERLHHHPFITIQYKMVIVSLSSWNERGLTDLDFVSARRYEEFYKERT